MSGIGTHLSFLSLCGISSYIYSSNTLSKYAVLDDPETTCLLSCLIAAVVTRLTSFYIDRLPISRGCFHEYSSLKSDASPATSLPHGVPRRPLAFHPYLLFLTLILRISTFHFVNRSQQCSSPGVEAWTAAAIAVYDLAVNTTKPEVASDEPEDMWATVWDDVTVWLQRARITGFVIVLAISFATNVAMRQVVASTYICSGMSDSPGWVYMGQLFGVLLNVLITVLVWQVLWWANTAKGRLQIISDALFVISLGLAIMILPGKYSATANPYSVSFSMVLHDGFLLAIFLVSFVHIICDVSMVIGPTLVIAFVGITAAIQNINKQGTWQQLTRWTSIGPLFLIFVALFLLAASMKYSQLGIRSRLIIYLALTASLISCVISSFFDTSPFGTHPIKRLIYDQRIENDRWLLHAAGSKSLRVAVNEYKSRYNRDPPPGFDTWFSWAIDHNSAIIDAFDQITDDLAPFWHLSPAEIKKRTREMDGDPDVALIIIKGTTVAIKMPDGVKVPELDEIVSIISEFAMYLPEMEFAVNLVDHPRSLPHGADRISSQGLLSTELGVETVAFNPGTSSTSSTSSFEAQSTKRETQEGVFYVPYEWSLTEATTFRNMFANACPVGSPMTLERSYTLSTHCRECELTHGQSWGMLPANWNAALDMCLQPDLTHLTSFFAYPPTSHRIYGRLMPLFSKSKTSPFGDILLPLEKHLPIDFDSESSFDGRKNTVFWRGYFTEASVHQPDAVSPLGNERMAHEQAFRGDLQHRLVHLINNASSLHKVTMLLPHNDNSDNREFEYNHMSAQLMNNVLPFDIAFAENSPLCKDEATDCSRALSEFAVRPAAFPLNHRYVILPDNPLGPAPELLRTLASESVPILSTVYRHWFTERLMPWVHFVPLDPRLTALHTTVAYFTGVSIPPREHYQNGEQPTEEERKKAEKLYGARRISMPGAMEDARWVAMQGKSWYKRALRKEDRGVYLFRLLLEWARLLREDRVTAGLSSTSV